MTWTAPATAVTGNTLTAAFWNAQVRDNMLETSAATAAAAGDLIYADAANSMGSRLAIASAPRILATTGTAPVWREVKQLLSNNLYTSQTEASLPGSPGTYQSLDHVTWSSGTSVTVTLTTGTTARVDFGARNVRSSIAGEQVILSYAVSGATSVTANDAWATTDESGNAQDNNSPGRSHLQTGLTAGSNTFTLQARSSATGATVILNAPFIIVQAL